jgi:hypothetical protein
MQGLRIYSNLFMGTGTGTGTVCINRVIAGTVELLIYSNLLIGTGTDTGTVCINRVITGTVELIIYLFNFVQFIISTGAWGGNVIKRGWCRVPVPVRYA